NISLLHNGKQSLFRALTRFEQRRKITAFAKLRNAQIKGADSCMPFPMPIAVPLVGSFCVAFITFGTNLGCNLRLHQRMNKNIQSFFEKIYITIKTRLSSVCENVRLTVL